MNGNVDAAWNCSGASSVFRSGAKQTQKFTPLYRAATIGKKAVKRREVEKPDPETLGKDW